VVVRTDSHRRTGAILVLVLALEAGAFSALVIRDVESFVAIHAFASVLAAFAIPHRTMAIGPRIGAFLLVASMPPLGALSLVVGYLGALFFEKRDARFAGRLIVPYVGEDDSDDERLAVVTDVIVGVIEPPSRRVQAIMSLRRVDTRHVVPILRHALRDPDDEVRLLAYAMLDRRDEAIQRRLRDAFERLTGAPDAERSGLHRAIAENYWELVHSGLSAGEVATRALESAAYHAAESSALEPHVSTFLLESRAQLRLGRVPAAERALDAALRAGAAPTSVLPLLAEIAFRTRRFDLVRHCLLSLDTGTGGRPKIGSVQRFWTDGGEA